MNGRYQPIAIAQLGDHTWQGYSPALRLYLRWERGQLRWHDPATGRHIVTFADERAARIYAEARVRQLEAERRRNR